MKVKELKQLLENFDENSEICIQTKSKNTPCLYGISCLNSSHISLQQIKEEPPYVAIGDIVMPDDDGRTCFGERIKTIGDYIDGTK